MIIRTLLLLLHQTFSLQRDYRRTNSEFDDELNYKREHFGHSHYQNDVMSYHNMSSDSLIRLNRASGYQQNLQEIETLSILLSDELHAKFESATQYLVVSERLKHIPYSITGGYDTLNVVTKHVEQTLHLARSMLIKLRSEAQGAFKSFSTDDETGFDYVDRFSNVSATTNIPIKYKPDQRFIKPVNLANSSVSLPLDVYFNWTDIRLTIQWTSKLDRVFKDNLSGAVTGYYQHFSTPEGVMRSYPSLYQPRDGKWTFYDPRQKTWYSTGSMEPKSIVFLIDGSGSIYGEAMRLLKETVKNILLTLVSDLDYIDVAIFRDDVLSLVNCSTETPKLRRTTQATKSYLMHKIENSKWYGVSNVTRGFEYAFDLLGSYDHNTCHKLIVLFTDYTNENLTPYIDKRDEELGGDTHVVIFTYGYEGWIRRNLSEIAEHFEGYSVKINNLPQIFTAARGITNVFTRKAIREKAIQFPFSNSYNDGWGQGYIVTLLLPVLSTGNPPLYFPNTRDGSFLGVAGVDLPTRMFGEFSMANQQGCFTQAVNARGYVVYHPLFKHISMDEIDVKYHQFSYLVNSTDELEIENYLVYQNYSGTLETHSVISDSHFRAKYVTKYYVFMNPIEKSDFSLALFCPNKQQLTKRMDDSLADVKLMDMMEGVEMLGFTENFHCSYEDIAQATSQQQHMSINEFYEFITKTFHGDCADTLLQTLYEAYHFKKFNMVFGSFILTANGNRYTLNNDKLVRYADSTTMLLYNYISAIATKRSPLVVVEVEGINTHIMGKVVYHNTGIPMAIVGYNISSFHLTYIAKNVFERTQLKRHDVYVLDHSGYVLYSNRLKANGKFIGHIEPCAMTLMHQHNIYEYYEEGQCYHTCVRKPDEDLMASSPALRVSHFVSALVQALKTTLNLTLMLMVSLIKHVRGHEELQCCKYALFYQRNASYLIEARVLKMGCLEYSVAPIKGTNLLVLVAPRRSDECRCVMDPITLQSPKPIFAGPCTIDDRNYNNRNYVCSEEIEHEPSGSGARAKMGFMSVIMVSVIGIVLGKIRF